MFELILILALSYQQETFVCTVVEPDKIVTCPKWGNPKNGLVEYRIDLLDSKLVDEWRWDVEHRDQGDLGRTFDYDAPLVKVPLKKGQKVKATLGENGELIPLARCPVRTWYKLREFAKVGQLPSNSARRLPDDCVETVRY